jgi:type I restriction-modification system DNA methylase subunit
MKNENNENMKNVTSESKIMNYVDEMLKKDYGYSQDQIKFQVVLQNRPSQKIADVVIYDSKDKDKILCIVEVKSSQFLLPLASNQLIQYMKITGAKYGMLYNMQQKICYEKIGKDILPINDIPSRKKLDKIQSVFDPNVTAWKIYDQSRQFMSQTEFTFELLKLLLCKYIDEKINKTNHLKNLTTNYDHVYLTLKQLWRVAHDEFPILMDDKLMIEPMLSYRLTRILEDFQFDQIDMFEFVSSLIKRSYHKFYPISIIDDNVTDLMLELLDYKQNKKIYYPLSGSGQSLLRVIKFIKKNFNDEGTDIRDYLFCTDNDPKLVDFANIVSILTIGYPLVSLDKGKSRSDLINKYELAILTRPILTRNSIAHVDYLSQTVLEMINRLTVGGRMVIIVPRNFLFEHGFREQIRKQISQKCDLKAIIKTPLRTVLTFSGVKCAILVLEKQTFDQKSKLLGESMTFVSDSESEEKSSKSDIREIFKIISSRYNEFITKNHIKKPDAFGFLRDTSRISYQDWDISSYSTLEDRISKLENIIDLGKICDITTGKAILRKYLSENGKRIPYIRIGDIEEYRLKDKIEKTIQISENKINQLGSETFAERGDILISCQATIGKVAIVSKKHEGSYISPQLAILRLKSNNVIPEYLIQTLRAKTAQEQLKSKARGSVIRRVSVQSLREIRIPLPSVERQREKLAQFEFLTKQIGKLQEKIAHLKNELEEFEEREI